MARILRGGSSSGGGGRGGGSSSHGSTAGAAAVGAIVGSHSGSGHSSGHGGCNQACKISLIAVGSIVGAIILLSLIFLCLGAWYDWKSTRPVHRYFRRNKRPADQLAPVGADATADPMAKNDAAAAAAADPLAKMATPGHEFSAPKAATPKPIV